MCLLYWSQTTLFRGKRKSVTTFASKIHTVIVAPDFRRDRRSASLHQAY